MGSEHWYKDEYVQRVRVLQRNKGGIRRQKVGIKGEEKRV